MNRLTLAFFVTAVFVYSSGQVAAQSAGAQSDTDRQRGTRPSSSITVNQSQQQQVRIQSGTQSRRSDRGRRGGQGDVSGNRQNHPNGQAGSRQTRGQRGANQNAQGRRSGVTRTDSPQQFTDNAMLFDIDGDSQLAAHELRNMFVILVSQQQEQQVNIRGNGSSPTNSNLQNTQGAINQNGSSPMTSGSGGGGGQVAQGAAIRQAIFIFLQLVMQFDSNGDGLLSQAELQQFANSLLQNDMNLVGAAGSQMMGGRGSNPAFSGQNGSRLPRQQQPQNRTRISQQQQQEVSVLLGRSGRQGGSRGRGGERQGSGNRGRSGNGQRGNQRPANSAANQ